MSDTIIDRKVKKSTKKKELDSIKFLISKGNLPKAASEMFHYIERYPDDVFGHFQYGKILLKLNDFEGAKEEFETVISVNGKNKYSALTSLGRIAELEKDPDLAREYYNRAIADNPFNELRATLALAHLEKEEGYFAEALIVLNKAPYSSIALELEKAKLFTLMEKYQEAETILEHIRPENHEQEREIFLEKGKIYSVRREYDKAKAYYLNAINSEERDKIYYQTLMELARLSKDTYNYEELVMYAEKLYSTGKVFNGAANIMLGLGKLGIGQYKQAKTVFEMSLNVADYKYRGQAAYYLSSLHALEGNILAAEKVLKESIKTNRAPYRLCYIKLIKLLLEQGKYEEAENYMHEIEEKDRYLEEDLSFRRLRLLQDKSQGKTLPSRTTYGYLESQIISYRKNETLAHIKENHQNGKIDSDNFPKSVDIETLMEDISLQLTDETKLNLIVMDEYEISYPNAGYCNGEVCDIIRVVTLPGTKDIVTMYPAKKSLLPTYGTYRKYLQKEESRTSSQTSKFKARWEKFNNQNK